MENLLQLFTDHNRKMATAISVIVIVLMSLSVANAVLFALEQRSQLPIDLTVPAGPAPESLRRESYKVSDLELFGSLQETAITQVVDAPETKLNLELQGIFLADDDSQSTAIIGEKAKTGELYVIGDRLPGNATLAAVYDDHVLIRRGTRMEKLMFSDTRFTMSQNSTGSRSGTGASRINTGGSNVPQASSPRDNLERIRDRIRNQTGQPATVNTGHDADSSAGSQALSDYRDRLQQDPAGALQEIGVSPISDGSADGYRVGADAPDVVRRAGIQPGDVILSVNGRPVGVAANDSALMDQVMASSRVRVEVQRGSRRFFLTVPIPKQ